MPFPLRLVQLSLPSPSTAPQPLVVSSAPVSQRVSLGYAHQHALASEDRQARRAICGGIDTVIVVQVGRRRACNLP
ncbi:putative 2-hydroxyisoflavanone dehydratase [Iris pallida]|uniref:2-hydroxyisoflavanone dehydratase n=1 Tax=Iris pallida TaxID=29817 RepID=A0AAX6FCF4_IRIPA|nr:putative 2-hydroxyisoflavanone dehydratase [Iris pallida]KAJ6849659.1 putative 2-hydroxyisoflavanone dehydratase [Iris pallida]